jgi:hypothetical protein
MMILFILYSVKICYSCNLTEISPSVAKLQVIYNYLLIVNILTFFVVMKFYWTVVKPVCCVGGNNK